jgi:hypothetical protein
MVSLSLQSLKRPYTVHSQWSAMPLGCSAHVVHTYWHEHALLIWSAVSVHTEGAAGAPHPSGGGLGGDGAMLPPVGLVASMCALSVAVSAARIAASALLLARFDCSLPSALRSYSCTAALDPG